MFSYPISNIAVGDNIKYYLGDFPELPSVLVDPHTDADRPWRDELRDKAIGVLRDRMMGNKILPYPSDTYGKACVHFNTTIQCKLMIYAQLKVRGLKQADLATLANTSTRAVSEALNLRIPTRIETLERIMEAMGPEFRVDVVPIDDRG